MAGALVITLREGLEAALIVSIMLAYLSRTGRSRESAAVWIGVALASLVSVVAGYAVFTAIGSLEGQTEQLFEGIALLAAVGVLTYTIVWMRKQSHGISGTLRRRVEATSTSKTPIALLALAFFVVVREGLETALFLIGAAGVADGAGAALGGVIGLVVAVGVGVLLYRGALHLNVGKFFAVTGVLLIVFAAGMLGRGVHEFIEAGIVPSLVAPVWDINPILSDEAGVGLFLRALVGYIGDPTLTEILAYCAYLLVMALPLLQGLNTRRPSHAGSAA